MHQRLTLDILNDGSTEASMVAAFKCRRGLQSMHSLQQIAAGTLELPLAEIRSELGRNTSNAGCDRNTWTEDHRSLPLSR
jgi:hypothetical protein